MQDSVRYLAEGTVLDPSDPVQGLKSHLNLYFRGKHGMFSRTGLGKHGGGGETPVMTCGIGYSCAHIRLGFETFLSTACSHRCPVNPSKHLQRNFVFPSVIFKMKHSPPFTQKFF